MKTWKESWGMHVAVTTVAALSVRWYYRKDFRLSQRKPYMIQLRRSIPLHSDLMRVEFVGK